ncbi:uncharacterized protein STEHIDRAFT_164134 [Stereum hirsutum FP-91666 SS1]|uniref:Uncharacterized protein n=1 Tax=Stereum hirsutum (strain FP-91666) TaxID=721885 RepID=R7RW49_STEHR|nr:uncharacterized protein STEHIDRAFT_156052 [Stereum hirsutum FP-91666 SS1]XP_007311924.1 uncharacterized protein STEHIDRAFT_164134 [Stereum hirsutum FP-91666 SS1]EIM78978.1 hypothetical protein STEHIDRAFT_164134 [Stereum hirsutum FP-91666 SS1]EIM87058.1 hypothetical protein STEHIDRAFT_156052 [Stereum hirsutum FP-91666 SS1]
MSSACSEAWRLVRQASDEHGAGASGFELLMGTATLIFELEVEVFLLEVGDPGVSAMREECPKVGGATSSTCGLCICGSASSSTQVRLRAVELILPCFLHLDKALLPLYGDHQLDSLAIAATVISTLLTRSSCACAERALSWLRRPSAEMLAAAGINAADWPGRLSFHPLCVSALHYVLSSYDDGGRHITVLAEDAHDPASSTILASYISHLLSIATTHSHTSSNTHRTNYFTYILALTLSHSPPQTLTHLVSLYFPPPPPHSPSSASIFAPPQLPPVSSTLSSNAQTSATSPSSNSVKSLSPSPVAVACATTSAIADARAAEITTDVSEAVN